MQFFRCRPCNQLGAPTLHPISPATSQETCSFAFKYDYFGLHPLYVKLPSAPWCPSLQYISPHRTRRGHQHEYATDSSPTNQVARSSPGSIEDCLHSNVTALTCYTLAAFTMLSRHENVPWPRGLRAAPLSFTTAFRQRPCHYCTSLVVHLVCITDVVASFALPTFLSDAPT